MEPSSGGITMLDTNPVPRLDPRSDHFWTAAAKLLEKLAVFLSQFLRNTKPKRRQQELFCLLMYCWIVITISIVMLPSLSLFAAKELCVKCFGLSIDCSACWIFVLVHRPQCVRFRLSFVQPRTLQLLSHLSWSLCEKLRQTRNTRVQEELLCCSPMDKGCRKRTNYRTMVIFRFSILFTFVVAKLRPDLIALFSIMIHFVEPFPFQKCTM